MTDPKDTTMRSEVNAAIHQGLVEAAKDEPYFSKECFTVVLLLLLTVALIALSGFSVLGFSIRKGIPTSGDASSSPAPPSHWGHVPDEDKPVRTAIKYNVSYGDAIYQDRNHTTVCVYQGRSQHRVSMGSQYGLPLFPFPYCHVALYCCLTITHRYAIQPQPRHPRSFYGFRTLVESNPVLEAYAIIGGQPQDSKSFQDLLDDPKARTAFIRNAKAWCHTNKFRGLYLHWNGPSEEHRDDLTETFLEIGRGLAAIGRKLGVIVTQDPSRYSAFDVDQLANIFGRNSILLVPLEFSAVHYAPYTFEYYANETISVTSAFLKNQTDPSNNNVCFLLHGAALSFQLVHPNRSIHSNASSLGPGPGGPIMKQVGLLSYTEVCTVTRNCTLSATLYSEEALCKNIWITYPTLASVRQFMCDMQRVTGIHCFGLWDSDWDDFAGRCGHGDFPLTRTIFERGLHRCELGAETAINL